VEVKIGVQHAPRELVVDSEETVETLEKAIGEAVADGTRVLTLTDRKGRKVIVPSAKIAYVEIGSPVVGTVGFRG